MRGQRQIFQISNKGAQKMMEGKFLLRKSADREKKERGSLNTGGGKQCKRRLSVVLGGGFLKKIVRLPL